MSREKITFRSSLFFLGVFLHLMLIQMNPLLGQTQQIQEQIIRKADELFKDFKYKEVIAFLKEEQKKLVDENYQVKALEFVTYSYYHLQDKVKVREKYRELLQLNANHSPDPNYVSPELVKELEKIKQESLAFLILQSTPKNLQVYIDDRLQKLKTPNRYVILDGQHHIRIVSPDTLKYKPWEEIELFIAGAEKTLTATLESVPDLPPPVVEKPSKPIYKKFWIWAAVATVAGIGIASALIIKNGNGNGGPKSLPAPPDRPSK